MGRGRASAPCRIREEKGHFWEDVEPQEAEKLRLMGILEAQRAAIHIM
jgi:hypothetical protein